MKKQISTMLLVVLMVMAMLVGCAAPAVEAAPAAQEQPAAAAEEQAPEEAKKELVIGYNAFSDTVEFSQQVSDSMKRNAEAVGARLLRADCSGDATAALANGDAFIVQGATVIVDSSWAVGATEGLTKLCGENGIPCIAIDTLVDGAYFYGVNNLEAGKIAGHAAADYVKANWDGAVDQVVLSFNVHAGEEVKKRLEGITIAMTDDGIDVTGDKVLWVDPQNAGNTIAAQQLITDYLTAHPDYHKIVVGTQSDQEALGALSAAQAAGRTEDVIIVSHGCDTPAIENLRGDANCWIGSVAYFPEKYGDGIVQMCVDLANGVELPQCTYVENVFVSKTNLLEYYPE